MDPLGSSVFFPGENEEPDSDGCPNLFDHIGEEYASILFEALDLGVEQAPEFVPFAAARDVHGEKIFFRVAEDGTEFSEAVAQGRKLIAADAPPGTRFVALVWDGYLTLGDERTEAVFVEGYQVGRPFGVMMAQRYEQHPDGLIAIGNPTLLNQRPEPLVPRDRW